MKVLVIPGWYPGKYTPQNGNFYVEQVKYLHQAGVDVAVITADLDYRYYLHFDGFFRKRTFSVEDNVPIFRISGGGFPKINIFFLDLWSQKLYELYERYVAKFGKPDIIHAHNFWGGYVAMKLSQKEEIPYVFSEVFSGILSGDWPQWQKKIYVDICNNASEIIAVSRSLADVIEAKYYTRKCHIIPNFIDTDLFALKERKVLPEKFSFLGVGVLIPLKCFDLQLQAFAKIIEKGYDAKLLIIGLGKERKRLGELIVELGLTNHVTIKPEVSYERVVKEMQRADVFLLTSHTETFGIVVIEAMSVGTPVIATQTAGPIDILTKESGILVPINDVKGLARAMESMMDNYQDFNPERIRAIAVEKYSKGVVTASIIKLYLSVIDKIIFQ